MTPSRGKVINFPSSHKNSFFSSPSFHGKTGHFKGKGKLFSREIIPQSENFPSKKGNIHPIFPLRGKILPQKMLWVSKFRTCALNQEH